MPRRARLALPGVPLHIIQRGNNRQDCFFADEDRLLFLDCLARYAAESGCAIHAYVLMTNHVHLLLTPDAGDSAGWLMKRLGQRYVQSVNRRYQRSGTLWEGRFRSCLVEDELYLLRCHRYVELNPVRAGLVASPERYPWSSHGANALGRTDAVLTPHPIYRALGRAAAARQAAYRTLFGEDLSDEALDEIRRATNGNFALGSERFRDASAAALGRRVTPGRPGRPRRDPQPDGEPSPR